MPNITTCTRCGKAYEESSEERANERERLCGRCFAQQHLSDKYRDAITGINPAASRNLNTALRRTWGLS